MAASYLLEELQKLVALGRARDDLTLQVLGVLLAYSKTTSPA